MERDGVRGSAATDPPTTIVRKQGRKKPPNTIPEKGIADFHSHLLAGPYSAYFQRTPDAAPRLQAMLDSIQVPPVGAFTHKDIRWVLHMPDSPRRTPTVIDLDLERPPLPEKLESRVQVAYIPSDRVSDFITGEEGRRTDVDTRFVRTKWKEEGKFKAIRWNVHLLLER